MQKTYFEEMAERLLYEKRRQQGYFQPEQDESIEDMVDRYMAARQTNEQMAGPQKLRPLGAFTDAFMQSLAQKPAMMVRGATAFTGENVDEVLGAAAKRMESLVDPERKARADAALQGKLWPSQEDTPWYKIDPKLLPEVINTWSAQVGDQIPIMVSAVIGRVIGAKAGSIAGSAAGPGGALTGAAVGGLTGGWVPMAGMEAGGFLREAQYYNIDKDIAEKYARIYGPASGAIEYVQQLWNLKAFKGVSKEMQKKIVRQILEHVGGNIWEGLEEVSQGGLERYLMNRAVDEMEIRYPGLKIEKQAVFSKKESSREFGVGFGIGTIAGGAGTVRSEGARQFHRYIGQDARQVALTEKGAAGIARINPEWAKEMAEKEKPSRTDFEKVGLKGWSAAERQELSSLLKEELAKQEEERRYVQESLEEILNIPQRDTTVERQIIEGLDAVKRGELRGQEAEETQPSSPPSAEPDAATPTAAPAIDEAGKKAEPVSQPVEPEASHTPSVEAAKAETPTDVPPAGERPSEPKPEAAAAEKAEVYVQYGEGQAPNDVISGANRKPLKHGVPVEIEVFHGSGRSADQKVLADDALGNVLGDAKYYAVSEKVAELFGPDIVKETVKLNNPYIIDSNDDLSELVGNRPIPRSNAERIEFMKAARAEIDRRGYDGVIVNAPWSQDVGVGGKSIKLVREIFGSSQVVDLRRTAKKPVEVTKKQPYQMTPDEYVRSQRGKTRKTEATLRAEHRKAVQKAVAEGKSIRPQVQEMYPEGWPKKYSRKTPQEKAAIRRWNQSVGGYRAAITAAERRANDDLPPGRRQQIIQERAEKFRSHGYVEYIISEYETRMADLPSLSIAFPQNYEEARNEAAALGVPFSYIVKDTKRGKPYDEFLQEYYNIAPERGGYEVGAAQTTDFEHTPEAAVRILGEVLALGRTDEYGVPIKALQDLKKMDPVAELEVDVYEKLKDGELASEINAYIDKFVAELKEYGYDVKDDVADLYIKEKEDGVKQEKRTESQSTGEAVRSVPEGEGRQTGVQIRDIGDETDAKPELKTGEDDITGGVFDDAGGDDDIPFAKSPRPTKIRIGDAIYTRPLPFKAGKPNYSVLDRYQKEGAKLGLTAALEGRNFLLADGPGVGKTMQMLAIAYEYHKRTGKDVLIVSENDQVLKRFNEDGRKLNIDPAFFHLLTYSKLSRGKFDKNHQYGLIIFDESQNFKNIGSAKTISGRNLKADAKLYASATPFDTWHGAEYFLSEITGYSKEQIRMQLGYKVVEKVDSNGEVRESIKYEEGHDALTANKKVIQLRTQAIKNGQMVRRVIPFYGKVGKDVIHLRKQDLKTENEIVKFWDDEIATAEPSQRLAMAGQKTSELRRFLESVKAKAAIPKILADIRAGKDVVVVAGRYSNSFIQSIGEEMEAPLAFYERVFRENGIDYAKIYGTDKTFRSHEIDRFQSGDVRVALMTVEAAGVGIDLDDQTGGRPRTVYLDPAALKYAGDKFDQVIGRFSRRNTKTPTTIKLLVANASRSERHTMDVLDTKMLALQAIQNGADPETVSQWSDTESVESKPSVEDVTLTKPSLHSIEGMASQFYAGKTQDVGGPDANVANPAVAFGIKEMVALARDLLGDVPTLRRRISGSLVYGRFVGGNVGKILLKASTAKGPVIAQTNWMKKGLTKEQIEILREQQAKEWDVSPEEIEFEKHVKNNRIQYDVLILDPDFMAKILAHEIGHAADWFPDKNMKRGNILGHIAALNKFLKTMIGNTPLTVDHTLTPKEKAALERQARKMVKAMYPDKMKAGERDKLIRETKQELIREEVAKRGIFTKSDIMDELKALSVWWRPLTGEEDAKHMKYRYSPAELYADAVSVLLNNPDGLKQRAPKFYEAFFNYMSQRPEVKDAYTTILDKIYNGTTLQEALDRIDAGMRRGSELHLKKLKEQTIKKNEILKNIRAMFYSKFAEIYPLARAARRAGLITADEDPINATAEYRYTAAMIEGMMNQFQTRVYDTLVKHGIPLQDYDKYLIAMRVIGERGLKGAPEGMTITDWKQWLADKKLQYGERFKGFEQAHKAQWEIYQREVLDRVQAAEYFDDETMQKLRDEKYYARFDVVDYIEQRQGGFGNGLKLYERIGTFREIAPPLESTLLQAMGMLYSVNWNSAKRAVAQLNVKLDRAMEAEKKWDSNTKSWRFVEPTDTDLKLMLYMHKGKLHGFYVDKWQAMGFQQTDPDAWRTVAHIANAIAGVQKSIYTALNPAFWAVNVLKDSARTIINVPGANPLNVAYGVIRALPLAWKSEYGTDSAEILDMLRHGALISKANIAGIADPSILAVELMSMYTGRKHKGEKTTPLSIAARAWEFYKHLGQVTERASKIAAWRLIREKNPNMSLRDVAQMVRTEAGSPDFAEKGHLTWAINPFMLFVNPGIQGLTTDLRLASQTGRRGSFWMKMAAFQIMPKIVQWAIGAGVVTALLKALGADDDDEWYKYAKEAEDIISSQSDYIQTNYIVVPVGRDENGKAVALSIPMDHTGMAIGGLVHNLLNANKKGVSKALVNSVHYAAEQMPGGTQPIFTLVKWWRDYSIGRNPYDSWRDRKVIPQTIFDARALDPQKEALKILAKESAIQLGAGGFVRFQTGDPDRIKSTLEKTTYLPGIGPILSRFIRISDYGIRQDLEDTKEEVDAARKMELLNVQRAVRKAARGEILTAEEEQAMQDNVRYSRQVAKKLDVRTKGDAIAQALATASYDQRVAIYRKLRKDKGPKFDLTDYAEKDIISAGQVLQRRYTGARGQDPRKFRDERAEAMELLNILNVSVAEAIRAYRLNEARQKMMSSRR